MKAEPQSHFDKRVAERIGNVCPRTLRIGIAWAIRNEREDLVSFHTRVNRKGIRAFKFRVPDGRVFYALIKMPELQFVTVFASGYILRREGKPSISLGEA